METVRFFFLIFVRAISVTACFVLTLTGREHVRGGVPRVRADLGTRHRSIVGPGGRAGTIDGERGG